MTKLVSADVSRLYLPKPQQGGMVRNPMVVAPSPVPQIDFDAMRKLVQPDVLRRVELGTSEERVAKRG